MTDDGRSRSRTTEESERLFERARSTFPGGVSHNVRHRDPYPIYIDRADGPYLWDVDGNRYVDFWNNHAASLLGHRPAPVVQAVQERLEDGLHFGAQNAASIELGERIPDFVPGTERVRFCMSGTEATMYAVRLARAWTDRSTVLKVRGGWHGGNTDLAHDVNPPFDTPTTVGLPPEVDASVESVRLDDRDTLVDQLDRIGDELAAVIVDPRRSVIPDGRDVMSFLAEERSDRGYLLIVDEVVTGFRTAPGSYQAAVGIEGDLTTLGKILGGGMPIGAIAGRADVFDAARPDIDVSAEERVLAGGGTFADHPVTAAAGLATLEVIDAEPVHERTERFAAMARAGLTDVFDDADIDGEVWGMSSLIFVAFNLDGPLRTPDDVKAGTDKAALYRFQDELRERGYYFNPGSGGNISNALSEDHIEGLIEAAAEGIRDMQADDVV